MSHAHDRCALILIDCQQGFKDWDYWGANRNNPALEHNLLQLLNHWRANQLPIVHVVHHSRDVNSLLRRDKSSGEIWPELTPIAGEELIVKRENSSFIGTELEVYLRRNHINQLAIAGLTTNHCVSTTVRMAGNMGFDVRLVGEACATFDRVGPDGSTYAAQLIHDIALSDLHGEFCQVVNIGELLTNVANQCR
ncbi:cysteine hydrolase [Oceanospirillaceae bacterium]|nr:cysteine hydrolase [Oceanospirillaceae bacterium]MBT4998830.1 cysteine hydrolase [Oceanospirillaceae bacterium]MBT5630864.1 cysteine hydrolase [Oceanospirillaceae bacterium]MBT6100634.1 cysteine hydrolase [Oceanospirillaceae bacterium]MBT7674793.1 cysteine hydrolase [Oceanospirillaceae bacterium]